MAPLENPNKEIGFPSIVCIKPHPKPPVAAAKLVLIQANAAIEFAAKADPPLNPNHPNHRRHVPINVIETLLAV
jgi:hypothetical protein